MNRTLKGRTMAELLTRRIAWLNLPPKVENNLRAKVELLCREATIDGIQMGAEVARDYDKLSIHTHLVSECILGKLNVLRRKPRENPAAAATDKLLSQIERKVANIEGMTKFMAAMAKEKLAKTR